ncbi:TetR/AcrR family transcriptional regulator [Salinicola corii]|uniref:TetR/AcrR family transcriptional regulator n=1 Tax=Salinicola corii TaxID=2606937 RepID=A0A640WJ91_9GAMM|nr:TetR/AcrR family transcriptional regulator [Salinicola corii]KAA0020647.1 TetR/AcrR family transcriptional regulator [Salinicola corii]
MQKKVSSQPRARPRADKERNRARLIAAAKQVFAARGAAASLEQVASEAGVGIGTLYRHFPKRDVLLEAVYRQETDTLVDAADRLMAQQEPVEALREWLLLFVDFIDTKRDMADALNTLIGGPEPLYSGTPSHLASSIEALVDGAIKTGTFRIDIEPLDLLRAIAGVANIRPGQNWKPSAIRMVDLLIRGMQIER